MLLPSFDKFKEIFFRECPMFRKNFEDLESKFSDSWREEFDLHLEHLFHDNEEPYVDASKGYSRFAIDAMRLQRLFNKKHKYEDVSYEEACKNVYHNEDYMMKLYLPGIFVSHFLWYHHYKQFLFYNDNFLPFFDKTSDKEIYDVGTGTGFYSLQVLRHDTNAKVYGIDISEHSRKFTLDNVKAWNYQDRFSSLNKNIFTSALQPKQFIQCIEVLEHLSDPQLFLNSLRKLLKTGGYGFITAALTAPNADHIYLYWEPKEVIEQLNNAGFAVLNYIEELAYEGKKGEYVPKLAAFIVS
jgi:2-polyprenyl-3-methyl-5-hydroxy-6-metoxy-1,4-benzoquinol methylase